MGALRGEEARLGHSLRKTAPWPRDRRQGEGAQVAPQAGWDLCLAVGTIAWDLEEKPQYVGTHGQLVREEEAVATIQILKFAFDNHPGELDSPTGWDPPSLGPGDSSAPVTLQPMNPAGSCLRLPHL